MSAGFRIRLCSACTVVCCGAQHAGDQPCVAPSSARQQPKAHLSIAAAWISRLERLGSMAREANRWRGTCLAMFV